MIFRDFYTKNVPLTRMEIIKRFSESTGFSFKTPVMIDNTYFNTIAQSNLVGQLVIRQVDDTNLAFSDNGGILAITGNINFTDIGPETTQIDISLKFPFFSIKLPQRIMFVLLIVGLISLMEFPFLAIILFFLSGLLLFVLLIKALTILFIRQKISKALDSDNKWN